MEDGACACVTDRECRAVVPVFSPLVKEVEGEADWKGEGGGGDEEEEEKEEGGGEEGGGHVEVGGEE